MTIDAFRGCLSPEELQRVQSYGTVQAMHAVATQVQQRCSNANIKSRLVRLVQVVSLYSGGMGILPTPHSECVGLIWGGMNILLQVRRQPSVLPSLFRNPLRDPDIIAGIYEVFHIAG